MSQVAGSHPRQDSFASRRAALPFRIGEIIVDQIRKGGFDLRHRDDVNRDDLCLRTSAETAAEIARYDDAGKYRPLKTAPNLAHGWCLRVPDASAVRAALDLLYPGRIAALLAFENGALVMTPLRDTLARQTGMYRVAAHLTEQQADELVAGFCRSDGGCLRTILWRRDATGAPASRLLPLTKFDPAFDQTGRSELTAPLLCQEACNLLVAEARAVVKSDEK